MECVLFVFVLSEMDNHLKLLEVYCFVLFIALARESNLSSLKKRGLYAHLLKTVEGGGRGPTYLGEEVTKSPSKIEKPRNPGYKVPLSQLKALRKKDDIVSAGQYERDTFVPAKTKGINFGLFILKCAILQLAQTFFNDYAELRLITNSIATFAKLADI